MMRNRTVLLATIIGVLAVGAEDSKESAHHPIAVGDGYRIEQPGTITFTVGVKIKGKVEKPQVVIFLPKERPQYREMSFIHSFRSDIMKPLPFVPIEE